MPASRFSRWSVELYNRHFDRPLTRSLPFALVTMLFLMTLAWEVWIVAASWPAAPPGGALRFGAVVVLTPLMWLRGIVQHRRQQTGVVWLGATSRRGLSIGGAVAYDYLYTAMVGYLLLTVVLGLVSK